MTPLILFVLLGLTILVLFEWRARRQTEQQRQTEEQQTAEKQRQNQQGECCGQHLVCERQLTPLSAPEYYDDEELDSLAGIPAEQLSADQTNMLGEVFSSLQAADVEGWVRSLQMRNINIPSPLRDEILLVLREQRASSAADTVVIR